MRKHSFGSFLLSLMLVFSFLSVEKNVLAADEKDKEKPVETKAKKPVRELTEEEKKKIKKMAEHPLPDMPKLPASGASVVPQNPNPARIPGAYSANYGAPSAPRISEPPRIPTPPVLPQIPQVPQSPQAPQSAPITAEEAEKQEQERLAAQKGELVADKENKVDRNSSAAVNEERQPTPEQKVYPKQPKKKSWF